MTFTEKLKRLAADVNKSRTGNAVGLGKTSISNYIAKESIPRADIALKMARAFNVPLEWLVDPAVGWPPPARSPSPGAASDSDVVDEFRRRLAFAAIDMRESLEHAEKQDWRAATIKLAELPITEKVPSEIAGVLAVEEAVEGRRHQLNRFQMEQEGNEFWKGIADPDEGDELGIDTLIRRHRALASSSDYGKFRHLVWQRLSLDLADAYTADSVDKDRRKILAEVRADKKNR